MREEGIEWEPSVPEMTQSPSLLAQQRIIEDEATGSFLNDLVERSKSNTKAIEDYSKELAPGVDVDPEFIVDTAKNKIDTIGEDIDAAISSVKLKKEDLSGNVFPVDRISKGSQIRSAIDSARNEASVEMSVLAESLKLNDVDLTDSFDEFKSFLKTKYKPKSRFEDVKSLPKIYREIIKGKFSKKTKILGPDGKPIEVPETIVFNDIKAIRERLTSVASWNTCA